MNQLSPALREAVERSRRYWAGALDQVDLRTTLRWAKQSLREAHKQVQEQLGSRTELAQRAQGLRQLELLEQLQSALEGLEHDEQAASRLQSLCQRWEGLHAVEAPLPAEVGRCSRCQSPLSASGQSCSGCGWSWGEAREVTGKSEVEVSPDLFELHRRCRAWLGNELPPEDVLSWVIGLQAKYGIALEQLRQSPPPEPLTERWRGLQLALLDLLDGLHSVQEAVQACRPEAVMSAWNLLLMGFESFQQQALELQPGATPPAE